MKYNVVFSAHTGMTFPILTGVELAEARQRAARRLRYLRRSRHPVYMLAKGREWESSEPPGSHLVPDTAGLLFIEGPYGAATEED